MAMTRKRVEKLFDNAIKLIEKIKSGEVKINLFTKDNYDNLVIRNEYKGYIASFGASIVQAGLKPTVAFFERTDQESKGKAEIMKAILYLIDEDYYSESEEDNRKLIRYIIDNEERDSDIKRDIIDSAAALKLAMRVNRFSD